MKRASRSTVHVLSFPIAELFRVSHECERKNIPIVRLDRKTKPIMAKKTLTQVPTTVKIDNAEKQAPGLDVSLKNVPDDAMLDIAEKALEKEAAKQTSTPAKKGTVAKAVTVAKPKIEKPDFSSVKLAAGKRSSVTDLQSNQVGFILDGYTTQELLDVYQQMQALSKQMPVEICIGGVLKNVADNTLYKVTNMPATYANNVWTLTYGSASYIPGDSGVFGTARIVAVYSPAGWAKWYTSRVQSGLGEKLIVEKVVAPKPEKKPVATAKPAIVKTPNTIETPNGAAVVSDASLNELAEKIVEAVKTEEPEVKPEAEKTPLQKHAATVKGSGSQPVVVRRKQQLA